jgi:hypothetical protein
MLSILFSGKLMETQSVHYKDQRGRLTRMRKRKRKSATRRKREITGQMTGDTIRVPVLFKGEKFEGRCKRKGDKES